MTAVVMAPLVASPALTCMKCPHMKPPTLPAPPVLQVLSPHHTTPSCRNQGRPPNGTLDSNPPHLSEVPLRQPPLLLQMAWLPGRKLPAVTVTVCCLEVTGRPKRGCFPRVTRESRAQKTKDPLHPREAGCRCWLRDLAQPRVVALILKLPLTGTTCCPPCGTGLRLPLTAQDPGDD